MKTTPAIFCVGVQHFEDIKYTVTLGLRCMYKTASPLRSACVKAAWLLQVVPLQDWIKIFIQAKVLEVPKCTSTMAYIIA